MRFLPQLKKPTLWWQSLTLRLVLSFTLLSALLLTGLSFGLFHLISWQLQREDQNSLEEFSALIQSDLSQTPHQTIAATVKARLQKEVSVFHYHPYSIWILDQNHHILFQSGQLPAPVKTSLEKIMAQGQRNTSSKIQTYTTIPYRFALFSISTSKNNSPPLKAIVALDTVHHYTILEKLSEALWGVVFLGSLLFSALGVWLVQRELLVVKNFSTKMQALSFHNLNTQLSQETWPLEIQPLAETFDSLMAKVYTGIQSLQHFSSDLAHELKTPISNLRLETEVLLEQSRSPEDYIKCLHSNLEELARLSRMVDRLLLLARLDQEHPTLQRASVNLLTLVRKLMDYYDVLAAEQHISFKIIGTATVTVDSTLAEIALSNVISNAIKYSPPHRPIHIHLQQQGNGDAAILIEDWGDGIAQEQQPYIFNRLYRGDASRSQHIPGDGLGLALVKAIMVAHQGSVTVESILGQGTRMTLVFPKLQSDN